MKTCQGCGKQSDDADVFCWNCGQKINAAPPSTASRMAAMGMAGSAVSRSAAAGRRPAAAGGIGAAGQAAQAAPAAQHGAAEVDPRIATLLSGTLPRTMGQAVKQGVKDEDEAVVAGTCPYCGKRDQWLDLSGKELFGLAKQVGLGGMLKSIGSSFNGALESAPRRCPHCREVILVCPECYGVMKFTKAPSRTCPVCKIALT